MTNNHSPDEENRNIFFRAGVPLDTSFDESRFIDVGVGHRVSRFSMVTWIGLGMDVVSQMFSSLALSNSKVIDIDFWLWILVALVGNEFERS